MFILTPILVSIRPMVYEILTKTFVRYQRTNGRTDGRTNQPTNQPTNKTIHRDASQSLDASKNNFSALLHQLRSNGGSKKSFFFSKLRAKPEQGKSEMKNLEILTSVCWSEKNMQIKFIGGITFGFKTVKSDITWFSKCSDSKMKHTLCLPLTCWQKNMYQNLSSYSIA